MKNTLIQKFEEIRQEMISTGIEHGINHPKVLELSQYLDKLHIEIIKEEHNDHYERLF